MTVYIVTPNLEVWNSTKDIKISNLFITFSTRELAEEYIKNKSNGCLRVCCKKIIHEIEVDKVQ